MTAALLATLATKAALAAMTTLATIVKHQDLIATTPLPDRWSRSASRYPIHRALPSASRAIGSATAGRNARTAPDWKNSTATMAGLDLQLAITLHHL
jgi:hypothetical protein